VLGCWWWVLVLPASDNSEEPGTFLGTRVLGRGGGRDKGYASSGVESAASPGMSNGRKGDDWVGCPEWLPCSFLYLPHLGHSFLG
jgi:hypothetical protein